MRRSLFVALAIFVAATRAEAAPVWGEVFTLKQPDGSAVEVKIWGDEFYQVVESLDGYTLLRDPETHIICYAELGANGKSLVSTGIPAGSSAKSGLGLPLHLRIDAEEARRQAHAARARFSLQNPMAKANPWQPPQTGDVKGICLVVDFPDEAGTILPADVNAFCNTVGYSANGNNGSVRDYFYDVSNGALTYTNFVPDAYCTASREKAYYDNPAEDNGPKAVILIEEALDALDAAGFDFTQYDANGDGIVDAVNCFYAGTTASGWSMGLWPHSGVIAHTADGMQFLRYQITYMGNALRLGTFCHENGHMICWWPDLYDYDYDSAGVGRFCIMAGGGGSTNPVEPCGYLKDISGWATPHVFGDASQRGLSLAAGSNEVYKFINPGNPLEYYLIENRQKTGRDANLPDAGLAIWHIDRHGDNSLNEMTAARHFQVALVQADGRWDLEHDVNSGDNTDLWKAPTYTTCGPKTTPTTKWWSREPSYLLISNISASGPTMTFDYRGPGLPNVDSDGDGMSDWDETRDLNPSLSGVQNPFDPADDDSTGNMGSNEHDDVPDGQNDYDGDGVSNAKELLLGSNPLDPNGTLPASSTAGLCILAAWMGILLARACMRSEHAGNIRGEGEV